MGHVIVAGAGIIGLASALMLADDGHDVTVIERDGAPVPVDIEAAFRGWDRRGVQQYSLGHLLHPRGTQIMRTEVPGAFNTLRANGGLHQNFVKQLLSMQPGATIEDSDDRFDLLTGRRSAIEWSFATVAERHARVTVRRGVGIGGLVTGSPAMDGVPHVVGMRLETGEVVSGDLLIDATGRRSPTTTWLTDIGAQGPEEHIEDSGFAYYGRYYRSDDGSLPAFLAPGLTPFGSFSVLTLPADNGTWTVILYGTSDDKALRRLRDDDVFARVVGACPMHAHWLDGHAISEIESMVGVVDRHRRYVLDGTPCVTGMLSVGDASSCTNPSLGRGMTFGLMQASVMRATVAAHLDDPARLALAFDEATERDLRPWHDATTQIDRARVKEMRAVIDGRDPEPDPAAAIGATVFAAASTDPLCARISGELQGCLALPMEIFARPGVFDHVLRLAATTPVIPVPGPDRRQLLELVA